MLDNSNLYREYHYLARHEDILISSRLSLFLTTNAFIFAAFSTYLLTTENFNICLLIIPFLFIQFALLFYYSHILPAEISLRNIWLKINHLEKEEKLSHGTYKTRENSFEIFRKGSYYVSYLNYMRIVIVIWCCLSFISTKKVVDSLYKYVNESNIQSTIKIYIIIILASYFTIQTLRVVLLLRGSVLFILKELVMPVIIMIVEIIIIIQYFVDKFNVSITDKAVLFIFIYLLSFMILRIVNILYKITITLFNVAQENKYNNNLVEEILGDSGFKYKNVKDRLKNLIE